VSTGNADDGNAAKPDFDDEDDEMTEEMQDEPDGETLKMDAAC
jgi:hypothetical protein